VSGDMAPLREPGLDRASGAGDTSRRVSAGRHRAEPSLVKVLATTLHLWLRRRVLRTPDGARVAPWRWAAIAVAVALVASGVATGVVLSHSGGTVAAGRSHPRVTPAASRALAATTANEQAAAAWVVAEVGAGTRVACDATMCGYLQARGMPPSQQVVIKPGDPLPGPATVVVATPLVRAQVGSALAAGAPEILASFGNGPVQVLLRVTSAGGAAAYRAGARAAVQESARAGRALAAGGLVQGSAAARRQLVSGQVDRRLLSVLSKLAAKQALYLVTFAAAQPGASWPSPLRSVTVGRFAHSSDMVGAFTALHLLLAPYGGTVTKLHLPDGVTELVIRVPAPSPV
jgi:hypothetical protein